MKRDKSEAITVGQWSDDSVPHYRPAVNWVTFLGMPPRNHESPRNRLWTLPNMISMSRLVLAGMFIILEEPMVRVAIILTAALTDFLDGFVARISGQRSVIGALIDPIADRIFSLAAVLVVLANDLLTVGQFFIFISRDLATAIGFIVARIIPWLRPVVFRARLLGKAVTVLQLAILVTVFLWQGAVPGLIVAVGLLSAMSIVDYTLALWRARQRM